MFGRNQGYQILVQSFWGGCLLFAATTSHARIYLSQSKAMMDCIDLRPVKVVSISAGEYMQPMSRVRLMHELKLKVRALGLQSAYLSNRDTDAAGYQRYTAMAFRCLDKKAETKSDSTKAENAEKGLDEGDRKPGSEIEPTP
jgi:hypothetical protein